MDFDRIWARKENALRDAMVRGGATDQAIEKKVAEKRKVHDRMVDLAIAAKKKSLNDLAKMVTARAAQLAKDKDLAAERRAKKKSLNIPAIIALFLMSFLMVGCSGIRKAYLADDVQEINQVAFQDKVDVTVRYCDRYRQDGCWEHHGLYVPLTHEIHIAPEWYWEPHVYHVGIVAHEMIHAWLDQTNQEGKERTCHSWLFRQERDRVARALKIPVWAIPDGRREDKLDATRSMAYLERYMQQQINAVHGCPWNIHSDVGWPTQLYDADD